MMNNLLAVILAQATTTDPAAQQPFWAQMVPFVLILAIFYLVLIRPQMKAKKEQDALIASAKTGDRVVTSGGIVGTISNVKDTTVLLKVADNVKIEVLKSALTNVTKNDKAEASV